MAISPTSLLLNHSGMHLTLAFSPDGIFLAAASRGQLSGQSVEGGTMQIIRKPGKMIVWNTKEWMMQTQAEDYGFSDIAWHPSQYIIASSNERRVTLWEATTGNILRCFMDADITGLIGGFQKLSFSPNGQLLAVGVEDGFPNTDALIINSETGEEPYSIVTGDSDTTTPWVRFSSNGERVVGLNYTYDYTDTAYMWNALDGIPITTFKLNVGDDSGSRFYTSLTGRYLTTNGKSNIWELITQQEPQWHLRHTCNGHRYGVWYAEFSPDERILLTMGAEALEHEGDDKTAFSIRIWEVESGQELAVCAIPGKCFCFGISPDGRLLATMSAELANYFSNEAPEYVLTLWEVSSGHKLTSLATSSQKTNFLYHYPTSMTFSPDARWLAVSHLRHIEIWDIKQICLS